MSLEHEKSSITCWSRYLTGEIAGSWFLYYWSVLYLINAEMNRVLLVFALFSRSILTANIV